MNKLNSKTIRKALPQGIAEAMQDTKGNGHRLKQKRKAKETRAKSLGLEQEKSKLNFECLLLKIS
jgi:hypothetical protein